MTKQPPLTRTCTICGIEKSLSAFLYISGTQGTIYGSICSSCRSSGAKEKTISVHDDGRSSTSAGMRIGAKERLEIEKKQLQEQQERQEKQEKEVKKRDKVSLEHFERLEQKEKGEKDHRETYIEEKKKLEFLNYKSKQPASGPIGQKKEDPTLTPAPLLEEKQRITETINREEKAKQDQRATTLDLSGAPVLDQQHNVVSRDNPIFQQFLSWIGDAPIAKTISQLYRKSPPPLAKPQEKAINNAAKPQEKFYSQEKFHKSEKNQKETPQEFIEKTWGPSSRKP